MKPSCNILVHFGIGGSLLRRETHRPGSQPEIEHYRFTANGNLQAYMYENLLYVHYGYNDANTRTYKYSFDLNPNWVNGRLESVNFNPRTAMFYPNAYINFNNNGYYTKHYYNGMERIASRLGDRNISINVNDPELQDRKDQLDTNIRRNIVEITGYEFLPVGEEQTLEDPKPIYELPVIGISNLLPSADGIYYYHSNHLGSTCYVTDENATVQQGFLYAPFGEITNEHNAGWQSGVLPKYSFNAKELDEETGMYYYEARYYNPPTFISRDPLFEKYPTFSPYAYCVNNPVKFIDPTGEELVDDWVKNNKTNKYEWSDHATSSNNTPEGYSYVGDDNALLNDLNIRTVYETYEDCKNGYSPDKGQNYAAISRSRNCNNATIVVSVNVRSDRGNISSDNSIGKTFDGITFTGLVNQWSKTASRETNTMTYNGFLEITGTNNYRAQACFSHPSEACMFTSGTTPLQATVHISANDVYKNVLTYANIKLGHASASMFNGTKEFSWSLLQTPIFY